MRRLATSRCGTAGWQCARSLPLATTRSSEPHAIGTIDAIVHSSAFSPAAMFSNLVLSTRSSASESSSPPTPRSVAPLGVQLPPRDFLSPLSTTSSTTTGATSGPASFGNSQLRARVSASPIARFDIANAVASLSAELGHSDASGGRGTDQLRAAKAFARLPSGMSITPSSSPTPTPTSFMHARGPNAFEAAGTGVGGGPARLMYNAASAAASSLAAALTPTNTPKRRFPEHGFPRNGGPLTSDRTSTGPAAPASGTSSKGASTMFLYLLFFVAGMMFAYIALSSAHVASSEEASSSASLMGVFRRGASSHPAAPVNQFAAAASSQSAKSTPAQLPLCGPNNYDDGEWVFDESITNPPYISNEWDNVCDADGYTNTGEPLAPGVKRTIRPELQYVWRPRNCRLATYSRENFCRLLAGRNILFVGDSIAGQHLSSFVHLMRRPEEKDNLWIRDEYFRHDVMSVCEEFYPADENSAWPRAGRHPATGTALSGIRVGFKRNNFLNLHTHVNDTVAHREWNTNQSFVGEIARHSYDIVVINTGIWMVDAPLYRAMLTDISEFMRTNYPRVTVLWRSTQPGHAACHTHWARPQSRLYDIGDTKGGSARFRWEEADERNRIAREFFPEQFVDVATMTKLRPDGHMPGTYECGGRRSAWSMQSARFSLLLCLLFLRPLPKVNVSTTANPARWTSGTRSFFIAWRS